MKRRSIIFVLAALVGFSGIVQLMVISRATVPALDAVRFVEIARSIDHRGLVATVRSTSEQPLFPAWTWLVHQAMVCVSEDSPSAWVTSAQVAAAIPLVLAVVPVYLASRRLCESRGALVGGLMFCVLPAVARLGAEGLSDSTHLLWFAVAFWAVVESMVPLSQPTSDASGGRSVLGWLLLAGVATGLGLLSRVEIALLPIAWALSLAIFWFHPAWCQPRFRMAAAVGGYLLGLAIILGPYLIAVGALTPSAAVPRLLGRCEVAEPPAPAELSAQRVTQVVLANESPAHQTAVFAIKEYSIRQFGYLAALRRYFEELARAMNYWGLATLLVGFWVLRGAAARPMDRFGHVLFTVFSLAALQFAATSGYLEARHLMPLVVVGIGLAALGALVLGEWVANGLAKVGAIQLARPAATWSVAICGLVLCSVQVARPLHAVRAADRQAGLWLAAQRDASGPVLDTLGWTALYSGCSTFQYNQAKEAFADPRLAYVVVQRDETRGTSPRSRTLRYLLDTAAEVVARFPRDQATQSDVLVYRWHADRLDPKLIVHARANDPDRAVDGL